MRWRSHPVRYLLFVIVLGLGTSAPSYADDVVGTLFVRFEAKTRGLTEAQQLGVADALIKSGNLNDNLLEFKATTKPGSYPNLTFSLEANGNADKLYVTYNRSSHEKFPAVMDIDVPGAAVDARQDGSGLKKPIIDALIRVKFYLTTTKLDMDQNPTIHSQIWRDVPLGQEIMAKGAGTGVLKLGWDKKYSKLQFAILVPGKPTLVSTTYGYCPVPEWQVGTFVAVRHKSCDGKSDFKPCKGEPAQLRTARFYARAEEEYAADITGCQLNVPSTTIQ